MKKVIALICMAALLAGCHGAYENPYRVDTVVRIPVNPAEEITEPHTAETEPEVTEAPKKSTSSGKASGSSAGKNQSADKPTELPAPAPTEPPFSPSEYTPGPLEYAVLGQINGYRREVGAPELALEDALCEMAAVRSSEAARVWSHNRPDGRGFETVLEDYGYPYDEAAENLINGTGALDAAELVEKWMSSDSHKNTILNGSFTTAGVGLYETGGVSYITVLLVAGT